MTSSGSTLVGGPAGGVTNVCEPVARVLGSLASDPSPSR